MDNLPVHRARSRRRTNGSYDSGLGAEETQTHPTKAIRPDYFGLVYSSGLVPCCFCQDAIPFNQLVCLETGDHGEIEGSKISGVIGENVGDPMCLG
jgi:hypothetical protein